MSDDAEETEKKIEDNLKKDTVINSSLERTRRLLKSRISIESNASGTGGGLRQDPAVKLRERLKKISEMKEKEAAKVKDETEFKQEIGTDLHPIWIPCSLYTKYCIRYKLYNILYMIYRYTVY